MQVRASVKCIAAGHAREGQAGIIIADDGKTPQKNVTVRWDLDQADEVTKVADLLELGQN